MSFSVENSIQCAEQVFRSYPSEDPFSSFDFLNALDKADCLDNDSGWKSKCLNHKNGSVIPFYEKLNSQGEFVFDYAWANTYFRYGQPYYPKLVMSVPFTPVDLSLIHI